LHQSIVSQHSTPAQVTQVCEEDGRVAYVKSADGQLWPADVVVSNVDVPSSYGLLDSEYGRGREAALSGLDYSAGVIAFNWVLDRRYDQLLHHNIFLSGWCPSATQCAPQTRDRPQTTLRNTLPVPLSNRTFDFD
jgi:hypothetical protein